MSEESFGIGFVSCGFITRERHVPSVGYLPGVHVAGIQNRTRETAAEVATECRENDLGDPAVYGEGEIAALVENPDVDGVWVTSPNFTRADAVDAAIDAVEDGADLQGIAMEKPVARNLREAAHIVDRIDGAGIPHAYLENWPHEPAIRKMRELLWERGREAGRPYIARSQAEHGGPHSAWFWHGTRQGGGALTDMLCHALAGNHVLLSDPEPTDDDPGSPSGGSEPTAAGLEPVSVSADTETLKWSRERYASQLREEHDVDYESDPADDYARATVRYEDEHGDPVISEASGSWCYVGAGVRRTIELLGPEYSGQVVADEASSSVFFSDAVGAGEGWAEKQTATSGRMPVDAAGAVTGGFVAENRDAVDSFRRGENGTLDLEDGRRILRLCMAAYKAAETGQDVDLRETDLATYTPPPARE
ncbi:Gfo/Idh/MocA family protein [Natrarchaeobius chitinivorans]|uniref:Gfo/Idh/MocA family oxidoreductase n=1 Tax=Natrarchaeobius chitinivorans TaxID=1679083 RepID=A0A3N6LYR1_NATCH|nr:Gfo/Idh/MocA family oxidoreductase [Natrarchaeobius chitinivorans]RQG94247.1 gfo/Idh/MocA family oxidoreductase [Natrarchaeobius chitinivorans]